MSFRLLLLALAGGFIFIVGCVNPFARQDAMKTVPFEQKGRVEVDQEAEKTVTFRVPFAAAPEVTIKDDLINNNTRVIETKPDFFRIRNNNFQRVRIDWEAKGVRVAPEAKP